MFGLSCRGREKRETCLGGLLQDGQTKATIEVLDSKLPLYTFSNYDNTLVKPTVLAQHYWFVILPSQFLTGFYKIEVTILTTSWY